MAELKKSSEKPKEDPASAPPPAPPYVPPPSKGLAAEQEAGRRALERKHSVKAKEAERTKANTK